MSTLPVIPSPSSIITSGATQIIAEVQQLLAQGTVADSKNLWPVQNWSLPKRLGPAGVPGIEQFQHYSMVSGQFLEKSLGDANHAIATKQKDLNEKILGYFHKILLAQDGQFPDSPRKVKYIADALTFIKQIRTFMADCVELEACMTANIMFLKATEGRMIALIQNNITMLANLLNEICNWHLPALPSLASMFGGTYNWNGFNFNKPSGFNLMPNLDFQLGFNFNQCVPRKADFSSALSGVSSAGGLFLGSPNPTPPWKGTYSTPSSYADPAYIAQMQTTTSPVFDQSLTPAVMSTSLPAPASIISDYSLPPATYQANVASAVPALAAVVIQPGDSDFGSSPSAATQQAMQALSSRYLNLSNVTESGYDPNLTAAWLFYLDLNRTGRSGTWLSNMQAVYSASITPSITYLANNPVPWNQVLGTTTPQSAPVAIPLIKALKADTGNLHWRLSFVEAALLGYARTTTWDAFADTTFLDLFTGSEADYIQNVVDEALTSSVVLGQGTAVQPTPCTYPQAMANTLTQVIALAATRIEVNTTYQSLNPKFRFTYNMFAVASVVDRFTQFWRDFNANLVQFLALDPYLVDFVASYPEVLDSAIDPLGDPTIFQALETDAMSRNRTWVPGGILLSIPTAMVLVSTPTAASGWSNGVFDAAAYLASPAVLGQPAPVQAAMLRTNESYAALMTIQGNLLAAVQTTVNNAQISVNAVSLPGWEVETAADMPIPSGLGITIPFDTVDFNQTGFITDSMTITIPTPNPFVVNVIGNWDPTGPVGTRTITLTQNGVSVATDAESPATATPYTTQLSTSVTLSQGDVLQVIASHTLATPQILQAGSVFLGLVDQALAPTAPAPLPPGTSSGGGTSSPTVNFTTGQALPAFSAVAISAADGLVYPVDPTVTAPGVIPLMDGVAMSSASAAGQQIPVAVAYGSIYSDPSATWTPGVLLYVAADGSLTQNYTALTTQVRWIICVGKAASATTFIFEPHIPTNMIQTF